MITKMQETILWSKKDAYHYESFINDIHARDAKWNLLKAKWYKDIKVWQYIYVLLEKQFIL